MFKLVSESGSQDVTPLSAPSVSHHPNPDRNQDFLCLEREDYHKDGSGQCNRPLGSEDYGHATNLFIGSGGCATRSTMP